MPHVWHFFMQDLPKARQALDEVADWLTPGDTYEYETTRNSPGD